jgi:hypothetical protein
MGRSIHETFVAILMSVAGVAALVAVVAMASH